MARLFVPADRWSESTVLLSSDETRYLCRVLRLHTGDRVVLFDGQGSECDATLARIGPRAAELTIEARRATSVRCAPAVALLIGLPKGDKMELVIQKATELGVARIHPMVTARSVPQVDALRVSRRRPRWLKIAQEAARQSGRTDVPEIASPTSFRSALETLPAGGLRLLFWEEARAEPLRARIPQAPPEHVVVAVGPEGGFTPDEATQAKEQGFHAVGLGPRTLRAETAALAALAVLGYAIGDLG